MIGERVACWILEGILELLLVLLSMEKGDGLRSESEDCHFGGLWNGVTVALASSLIERHAKS